MIKCENITKAYATRAPVVRGVSLHVTPGELLVLLGASGCGKTTILKMINRLIEPTSGRVLIDGQDTAAIDPVKLRRRIGYVIQSVGLFPHMSVADNVATVPRLLGWSRARVRERVHTLLELVGLPPGEFARRWPRELSGGQRQRVGFARALAADPQVMLLDEPFGAIDPIARDALRNEFRKLQQSLGLTVLMVTHDMVEALLLADRIAVIHEGAVARIGTPRELLTDPGHPFVSALMESPRNQAQIIDALLHVEAGGRL